MHLCVRESEGVCTLHVSAFVFVVPLEILGIIKEYLKAERKQQDTRNNYALQKVSELDQGVDTEIHPNECFL